MTTENVIQEFENIFVKGNVFEEITLRRTKSLKKSSVLFEELKATKYKEEKTGIVYCKMVYANEEYCISPTAIVNSLHFTRVKFENKHSNLAKRLKTIKNRFYDDIFHYWDKEKNERCRRLSTREWVANLADNLEELGELLGAETLQSILPDRVLSIKQEGSFYPHEQWMIQSVKTMKGEIATIIELWKELHFEPKTKLAEIITQYKEIIHSKSKEDLHFCNTVSSIKEVTIVTKKLYDKNKVEELCYISGFGRGNSRGNFPEPTWKEICDWARANLTTKDLANFKPNLDFAPVDFQPASFSDITKFKDKIGKKELDYGNLRNYLWNKKVIAERVCSAILKDCIEAADPILRLEDAAFKIVSKHFFKKSRKELKNLVKQSSILNFFDLDNGLVANFHQNDQGIFLKMIFDIDKREFAKWVALKIQLDPRHLLMKLRQKESVCAEHVNPKTANYYRFSSKSEHKKCELENKDCWCLKKSFTEMDIRFIVLRYLADRPFMKTASSGVTHLIKHYFEWAESGELYLDRLEMLRGYRLDHHIAEYKSLANRLVSPEPETGSRKTWLESHKKYFMYSFGVTGSINVTFGRWNGEQDGVFVCLAIKESGEIFTKTLFSGAPSSFSHAKTFGVQSVWRNLRNHPQFWENVEKYLEKVTENANYFDLASCVRKFLAAEMIKSLCYDLKCVYCINCHLFAELYNLQDFKDKKTNGTPLEVMKLKGAQLI